LVDEGQTCKCIYEGTIESNNMNGNVLLSLSPNENACERQLASPDDTAGLREGPKWNAVRIDTGLSGNQAGTVSNTPSETQGTNTDSAEVWLNNGMALNQQRSFDEALQAFDKAIELNPQSADNWAWKAAALGNLGRDDESLDASNRAIELNPQNALAWHVKGLALHALGRADDAHIANSKASELGYLP